MRRRTSVTRGLVGAGVAAVVASLVLLPDLLRLDSWTPFVQLIAFRPAFAIAFLCLGLASIVPRRVRASGAALIVVAVVALAMVVPRTLDGSPASAGDRTVTVLAANVAAGRAEAADLRRVIRARQPDIIVLPEATESYRTALQEAVHARQYRARSAQTASSPVFALSVLVAADMGKIRFEVTSRENFPAIVISIGPDRDGLTVVGFHAYPPLPGAAGRLAHDLSQLRRWCGREPGPTVIAGDFNATLDHSALRDSTPGCVDSAAVLGDGLRGTWPSGLPAWLTPQIDHVLVGGEVAPRRISFVTLDGTDHRALLARLSVPT